MCALPGKLFTQDGVAFVCRRSDRLDWMYSGGMLAKQEADQRTEEAMMTGKPVQQEESTELNRVCSFTIAFATWSICYLVYIISKIATNFACARTNAGSTSSVVTNILFGRYASLSQRDMGPPA